MEKTKDQIVASRGWDVEELGWLLIIFNTSFNLLVNKLFQWLALFKKIEKNNPITFLRENCRHIWVEEDPAASFYSLLKPLD